MGQYNAIIMGRVIATKNNVFTVHSHRDTDRRTLTVTLDSPHPFWIYPLSTYSLLIVEKHRVL